MAQTACWCLSFLKMDLFWELMGSRKVQSSDFYYTSMGFVPVLNALLLWKPVCCQSPFFSDDMVNSCASAPFVSLWDVNGLVWVGKLSWTQKIFRASSDQFLFETAGLMMHSCLRTNSDGMTISKNFSSFFFIIIFFFMIHPLVFVVCSIWTI